LKTFLLIENAMPFIIGDLIGYGELQYEPSRYQEAIRLTGRTENILQNWASICRLIPPEDRIYDLSYSYYQEVSPLDKDQQHHFLSMALKRKWHKRWLRAHPASDGALIESRKGTLSPSTCEIRTYHEKGSKRFSRIMGSGLHGPIQKEDL
jgi:hypothetical protein